MWRALKRSGPIQIDLDSPSPARKKPTVAEATSLASGPAADTLPNPARVGQHEECGEDGGHNAENVQDVSLESELPAIPESDDDIMPSVGQVPSDEFEEEWRGL